MNMPGGKWQFQNIGLPLQEINENSRGIDFEHALLVFANITGNDKTDAVNGYFLMCCSSSLYGINLFIFHKNR